MTIPALSIQNLNKTYANGVMALQGVSFEVQQGDFFALLGPNGAGKSTILGVISTLVRKNSGTVKIFGIDLDRELLRARAQLGIVPQEFNFNNFETVRQTLFFQGAYYGLTRKEREWQTDKYLELLDLVPKAKARIQELSGGQKRRVMIARALIHEPKLLILDEPTAGVDIEIRHNMWRWTQELNRQGTTIVLTTHYLEEAQNLCRNIVIINHGKVIANTSIRELLRQVSNHKLLFEAKDPISEQQFATLRRAGYMFERKNDSDDHILILEFSKQQNLNHVLEQIIAANIELLSIQPDTNQLETLFMQLTKGKPASLSSNEATT